jgi:quinol monooxygenase YgiN
MVKVGIFVRLMAKPGKATEVEQLLMAGRALVLEESGTPLWFAVRFDTSTFGIFDAFADESARQAHLAGGLRQPLWLGRANCSPSRPELSVSTYLLKRAE